MFRVYLDDTISSRLSDNELLAYSCISNQDLTCKKILKRSPWCASRRLEVICGLRDWVSISQSTHTEIHMTEARTIYQVIEIIIGIASCHFHIAAELGEVS